MKYKKLIFMTMFISFVFFSFTIAGMATDVDTYSAYSTHMYSNTDWGSKDSPKYYMQISFRDSNNNWVDRAKVQIIQHGSPLDDDVVVFFGSGNGMWQDQYGSLVIPVRWQGYIDTSYSCGFWHTETCWHTAVTTGWWYLTPGNVNGWNYYAFSLYWSGHEGAYSTFSFKIYRSA